MNRYIFISLIILSLLSCSKNNSKKVFLELVLDSPKNETMKQINSLLVDGKIQKSKILYASSQADRYEYSFFINNREYPSQFYVYFDLQKESLKGICIEIKDYLNIIRSEDIRNLLKKKYGSPIDSTREGFGDFDIKNMYNTYYWITNEGVKISVERKFSPSNAFEIKGKFEYPYENNYIDIKYTDMTTHDFWQDMVIIRQERQRVDSKSNIEKKQENMDKDL